MICCKCKQHKPETDFAIDPTNRSGRSCTCKACKAIYKKEFRCKPEAILKQRLYRQKYNRKQSEIKQLEGIIKKIGKRVDRFEGILQSKIRGILHELGEYYNTPIVRKQCAKCGKIKDIDCFEPRPYGSKDGYNNHCKECRKPIYRENNKKKKLNPDYLRKQREYNKTPRRMADRKIRALLRREIVRNTGGRMSVKDILFVYNQFSDRCYNCGSTEDLQVDHHYPLSKGNQLTKVNAVLLCRTCNLRKHNKNPEEYYSILQMIELAIIYNKIYKGY